MTIEADIHGALMARAESLSLTPAVSVLWPGISAERPVGEHVEVHHLPNRNVRLGYGKTVERRGILQLTLCSEPGEEEYEYRKRAGQIAAHFPLDSEMMQGNARVRVMSVDVLPGRPDGNHYRTAVRIGYQVFT